MSSATLTTNAQIATFDMVDALESLIERDGAKAVIYGNSAIAAVIILFQKYEIDLTMNREVFHEFWSPITGSEAILSIE